jgi:hypothetical protein
MLPHEYDIAYRFWWFINKLFFRFTQQFTGARKSLKDVPDSSFSLFVPHSRPHEAVPHSSTSKSTIPTSQK